MVPPRAPSFTAAARPMSESAAAGARSRLRAADAVAANEEDPISATDPAVPDANPVRGSTTIVELLRRYPGGEAARLMSRLHWPCAHCR
jgi:hypothetical protein